MQHEALANIAFVGFQHHGSVPLRRVLPGRERAGRMSASPIPQIWLGGSRETVSGVRGRCRARTVQPAAGDQPGRGDAHRRAMRWTWPAPADAVNATPDCSGWPPERVADLLLVTTELATNSLDHAGGACRLAFWFESGFVVCEARDVGQWADPLAGRRPPGAAGAGPYGLFVVNAIADLLRTHTTSAGTTDPRVSAARRFLRSGKLTRPDARCSRRVRLIWGAMATKSKTAACRRRDSVVGDRRVCTSSDTANR